MAESIPWVRVIALGTSTASDDGAAIAAAQQLRTMPNVELVIAGRPGARLLDLLDPDMPTLLLEVVELGAACGNLLEVPLSELAHASVDAKPIASHGPGAAEALAIAHAQGRELPRGIFLGIGGRQFELGGDRSPEVEQAIEDLVMAARGAIEALQQID